jgi:hypothetical protein
MCMNTLQGMQFGVRPVVNSAVLNSINEMIASWQKAPVSHVASPEEMSCVKSLSSTRKPVLD